MSKYTHKDGSPFTKEEFLQKLKTDKEFNNEFGNKGIDQISELIKQLKDNPDNRRLLVSAWNISDLQHQVLPPCHYSFQVYTRELSQKERSDLKNSPPYKYGKPANGKLINERLLDSNNVPKRAISLMFNMRSCDTFLGLPFNIASYGLLLEIIAKAVNMVPDELIGNLGDVHLYSNHIEQAKEQIGRELSLEERKQIFEERGYVCDVWPFNSDWHGEYDGFKIPRRTREPYPLPKLVIEHSSLDPVELVYKIENYQSHPTIKAPLSN
jgi:thymidylate synthase